MKILYAYRYGIVGGVAMQLILRQQALHAEGVGCDLYFSQDNGLRVLLDGARGVFFGNRIRYGTLLNQGGYDHVIVIDTPELLAASYAAWWQRPRKVWLDVHTTTTMGLGYLAHIKAEKLTGVMVPTHYSAALVQNFLPAVLPAVIPNVINDKVFCPASASGSSKKSENIREFVWVGKFDSHKNWRLALVYARLLQELFGNVRFTLVGGYTASATTGQAFFEMADRLGLLAVIRWVDRIDNQQLVNLYRVCGCSGGAMLVTSRDESFGMAVAEALMSGCPVIANDLPVFREVFPDSPMIRRVDIWQPALVRQAAEALAVAPAADACRQMYEHLSSRFGPGAFLAALNAVLGA